MKERLFSAAKRAPEETRFSAGGNAEFPQARQVSGHDFSRAVSAYLNWSLGPACRNASNGHPHPDARQVSGHDFSRAVSAYLNWSLGPACRNASNGHPHPDARQVSGHDFSRAVSAYLNWPLGPVCRNTSNGHSSSRCKTSVRARLQSCHRRVSKLAFRPCLQKYV